MLQPLSDFARIRTRGFVESSVFSRTSGRGLPSIAIPHRSQVTLTRSVANEASMAVSLTAPLLRGAELYDRATCVVEGARDNAGIAQVAADHGAVAQHH